MSQSILRSIGLSAAGFVYGLILIFLGVMDAGGGHGTFVILGLVSSPLAGHSQISGRSARQIYPVFQGIRHLAHLGLIPGVGVNCPIQYRTS